MKTFRTIILIAGILVAGLALNTAVAQENYKQENKKSFKHDLKKDIKEHSKS
jgi:hypothetical protein